jgi:hypothetical protein
MSNIFPGDEGIVRVRVKDVKGDHVLVDSLNAPMREFWFPATYFERSTQGAASLDNDKRAASADAPPEPAVRAGNGAAVAVDEQASAKEQAIAHVMSKDYDRVAAEKIVEEVGTKTILEDRDDELRETAERKQRLEQANKAAAEPGAPMQAGTGTDKPEKPN